MHSSILQFGGGQFLRAFVDLFVSEARETGQDIGDVVVVQSTNSLRAKYFNSQLDGYNIIIRGIVNGGYSERIEPVRVVSKAIVAEENWKDVQTVVCKESVNWIVSNVTEAGYRLEVNDSIDNPRSFPAKVASVLFSRFNAGLSGMYLLPCELLAQNGRKLQKLVLRQSTAWNLPDSFFDWLSFDCIWADTLVDRIVSRPPVNHPLLEFDRLLAVAEPFAFWGIQASPQLPLFSHPSIEIVDNLKPYSMRKLRILNGAHTALVCRAMPRGIVTVREAMEDKGIRSWLEKLIFEEIVPVVENVTVEAKEFADSVLERLSNPYIDHKLEDIALYHETKLNTRLKPTFEEFIRLNGKAPVLLEKILS